MATQTKTQTYQLQLSSANGPIYRSVLKAPLRDALPSEIPVIDASGIFSSTPSARLAVAHQVRAAATNNGFFYIKNHGVPSETIDATYHACVDFFRQPLDIKDRANTDQSHHFNGYKPANTQRINPSESIDMRESFSSTYNSTHDPSVCDVATIPPEIQKYLHAESFHWEATSNLPHFKTAIIAHWQACLSLARALVHTFALSLDLPEDFFDAKITHPDATLNLNYYPPLPPQSQGPDQVSIGSHTDFQLFTILWQDHVGGLQVLDRVGQWINAVPIEGTFVVNIADYMQRITNDRYVSTVHRAQNYSGGERVSMPFFFGFNLNESCGVLDRCVGDGERKKYDEVSCDEWVRRRVGNMYDVKGENMTRA